MPDVAELLVAKPEAQTSMGEESDRHSYDSDILPAEKFWVVQQPFLLAHGYRLRPRYDPAWVPSWKGTSEKPVKNYEAEDAPRIRVRGIDPYFYAYASDGYALGACSGLMC
jgi:hypothetical protein